MTDFRRLLVTLAESGAEFILIGGVAATAHGASRVTRVVDVVYERSPENISRLAAALAPLAPYPRDAPPGLPFRWDSETIERGLNFTLTTDAGEIDLLGEVTGGGTFENLKSRSIPLSLYGIECLCLDLDTLIIVKRAAGRPKDFEAIAELESIREERESSEPEN